MIATRFCHGGLVACLCLMFSSFEARCQPTYGGITANSDVDLSGGGELDSFNSADPNHSIWQTNMTWYGMPYGIYSNSLSYSSNSLPSRTSDFTVAADGNILVEVPIFGFVNVAPTGNAEIEGIGSVGDLNWVSDGMHGIEPGHLGTNMTAVFYSKSLPVPVTASQTSWWPVPAPPGGSTNIGGVVYSLLITNQAANSNFVYYSMDNLAQNIFIDASNVVLYLTNGMRYDTFNLFTVNSNADVSIYSSGDITCAGGITNLTEYARAVSIYDVAGSTNLRFTFSGGANVGPAIIYAPGTSLYFIGGPFFIGTIFCQNISASGASVFHYDESLGAASLPIPPWITQQPVTRILQDGSNATFSVGAGGPSPAYQWFFGQGLASSAILSATNTSLIITNVQPANAGDYSVVISDAFGSVTSSPASLVVYSNTTATLSATLGSTNGQFQLTVNNIGNVAGMPYIIEASTNLMDWVSIWTNASPFSYTETNSFPDRYYRAVFNP